MIVLQTIAVAFAMFSAVPVPQFAWNEKNMRYAHVRLSAGGAVMRGCGACAACCPCRARRRRQGSALCRYG